jgi:hypothetical protein
LEPAGSIPRSERRRIFMGRVLLNSKKRARKKTWKTTRR